MTSSVGPPTADNGPPPNAFRAVFRGPPSTVRGRQDTRKSAANGKGIALQVLDLNGFVSASNLDTFCKSLDRLDVGWTRTSTAKLNSVLDRQVELPAVRAPWPFPDTQEGWSKFPSVGEREPLDEIQTGLTAARLGVANYGTVVLQHDGATERVSLLPERHVTVLRRSDLVPDMPAAFDRLGPLLRTEPTSLVLATGPSATADMGGLVRGAHGPRVVHVIICTDR